MDLQGLVEKARKLSNDDYENLMYQLLEQNRPGELMKRIRVRAQTVAVRCLKTEEGKKKQSGGSGVSLQRHSKEWPGPQTAEIPKETSKAAFKSPMIFRGDLIPDKSFVYFDVKKLSLMIEPGSSKHEQVASSVAVVNGESNIILWAFIKWEKICQTFPSLTGITKQKLEIGLPIDMVKPFFMMACSGNTLVGWDLGGDLTSMFVGGEMQVLDLTDYFQDDAGKMKLKDVWEELCNKKTESFQCGVHSAIQDARATRDVHKKMLELKIKYPSSNRCPVPIPRSQRAKFKYDPNDVCRCKKNTFKRPKQTVFFQPE